ncbi:YciI family protein [Streptomyces sp. NPDC059455]|uniref:YciI family protein n=1 Tax=Streptomyces sp. NPDC059455 TaxID=3346837 RepID=UPI0036C4D2EC
MKFFCYHRDRPGSLPLRQELVEQHWSYMDRYASEMIARGPTLSDAEGVPTGSVHIVDLPADRDELIAYGPLLSDEGSTWLGTAALVRAPDPETARAVLTPARYADIEVHRWQCGGRPS